MINDNTILEVIEDYKNKNKDFTIIIKTEKITKKYHYNVDGQINEVIEGKFYEEGKFMDKLFVDYFITKYDVIYSTGVGFLIFNGEIWENCSELRIQQLIAGILESEDELTNAKISSTSRMLINQINNDKLAELLNSNRNRLILKNGTLDISNIENFIFHEDKFFKEDYSTIQLNVSYNPNALKDNAENWKYYMTSTFENDAERMKLIGEMLGYCLTPNCKFHKSFMLVGEGSNGKSVLLDIMDYIWGSKNISDVDISELDRAFSRVSLFGKLINKSSEIEGNLKTTAFFKKIVSGDMIDGEYKGKDKFSFPSTVKLIFAMNSLPVTKDKSDGLYRRLCIIPFNKQFKGEEIDIDLSEKLKSEADSIFLFALSGLKRLHKQKKFTESVEVNNKLEEYKLDSNPVKQYIEEKYIKTDEEDKYISSISLYDAYVLWCGGNGFKSLNNVNFGKELKRLGYNKSQKRIKSKPTWVYLNLNKV